MTQSEKDLLLQDICSRLPYGVKVQLSHQIPFKLLSINTNGVAWVTGDKGYPFEINWSNCKPYLFPLSSMTEEQLKEYMTIPSGYQTIDWFNKNHFDYRCLIERGLAIDATNLNIY